MIIGLTGNIGSGKTFVANIFKKYGCKIIHLDEIGHQVLQSAECKKELINAFGNEIIDSEGKIDREKLRKVSFKTRENLNKLNSIVHPIMLKSLKNKISRNKNEKVIVLEAALLFELGLDKEMDKIIRKEFSYWEVAVFASPIPYLVKRLSFRAGAQHVDFVEGLDLRLNAGQVFIFHNDKREKKELPNVKVIFTVAKTGWKLV